VFGQHDDAVFGGILLAVMLFAPDGILQVRGRALLERLPGRRRAGEESP
jgi:ABC-type branched-subunit amino acid transport system permease subunit